MTCIDPELTPTGSRRWAMVAAGLAIAYSPSYINILLRDAGADWLPQGPASVLLWNWVAVAVLIGYIAAVERRGVESIGLRRPRRSDLLWAVAFWAVSFVISGVITAIAPTGPNEGLESVLKLSQGALAALVITTATTEEILFRGYPIERLRELTGRMWLAVAISFALFVLPHVRFFGPEWLLLQGVGVVLLYVLYVWRRNLWATMLMHFLGNAPLLLPATGGGD